MKVFVNGVSTKLQNCSVSYINVDIAKLLLILHVTTDVLYKSAMSDQQHH